MAPRDGGGTRSSRVIGRASRGGRCRGVGSFGSKGVNRVSDGGSASGSDGASLGDDSRRVAGVGWRGRASHSNAVVAVITIAIAITITITVATAAFSPAVDSYPVVDDIAAIVVGASSFTREGMGRVRYPLRGVLMAHAGAGRCTGAAHRDDFTALLLLLLLMVGRVLRIP